MAMDPRTGQRLQDRTGNDAPIPAGCGDPSFESEFLDPQQYHRNAARRLREQRPQAAWPHPAMPETPDE